MLRFLASFSSSKLVFIEAWDYQRSCIFIMNGHTTRFCFCASNLTSAVVLAGIFASLRVVAIFLLWYQIRPDINKTEGKTLIHYYLTFHVVWKSLKMSHLNFLILAFSTNFCPIKIELSGNTVWPQALDFQKFAKLTFFWHF